jgi:hypothetical protein
MRGNKTSERIYSFLKISEMFKCNIITDLTVNIIGVIMS